MDGTQQWSDDAQQYIQRLEQENQDLKEKIKDLEKRLVYYENPHTPPSAIKISKKKTQDGKKSDELGKRGAPKGHRGATRPKPKPDEIIDVTANKCEQCGSRNIQPLKEVTKNIIEDFLPPQKIKVTQFNRHKVKCMDCGEEFWTTKIMPQCPQCGSEDLEPL